MDALITLIMLGAFILSAVQKSEKQKGKKPVRQSVPNQRRQPDGPVQRKTSVTPDIFSQQQLQETKERLQRKYGLQQPVPKGDILSRAREHVQENEQDVIQQEVHAQVCREYRDIEHKIPDVEEHKIESVNCDAAEESDMMKRVNDLIVTGYSGEMNFDRDFVAAGIEMLTRFSL